MQKTARTTGGFTLIEMLVVVSIAAIVFTVVATTYTSVRKTGDASRAAAISATVLKEAVRKAEAMEFDTSWGVRISSTSTTLFSGTSYALRTPARDTVFVIPSGLTVSGLTDVVFAKFTGTPSATGTTTFTNGFGTSTAYVWTGGVIGNSN